MPGGIAGLLLAVAAFVAFHLAPSVGGLRGRLIARAGYAAYLVGHSIGSLVLTGWVAYAYAQAPYVEVWPPSPLVHAAPLIFMPLALLFAVATFSVPNPLSIGIGGKGFDPERPGWLRLSRHPLPHALGLWAFAHGLANGDVAGLIMFGLFLLLALMGGPILDLRARRKLGADEWRRLSAQTGQGRLRLAELDLWRPALALALYALSLWAHAYVVGVDPLALYGF